MSHTCVNSCHPLHLSTCVPVAECVQSLTGTKWDTLQWLLHPQPKNYSYFTVSRKCFCSNFWWLILQRNQRKCSFWGLMMGALYNAKEFAAQLSDSWHCTHLFCSMTLSLQSGGTLLCQATYLSHMQKRAQCFSQELALGHSISIAHTYLSHFGTESLGFARFSIDFFLQGLPPHLVCRKITHAA